ncbi:MAG TPA: O-antigen ligase family protein, partial [Patescibacteria group bacterium]|nr:O-antigen ligase family protein [Patescibacteria group bacterium]
ILGVTIIILAMVALLLLWANKNSSFVANNRILNRMTEVSLNTRTAQNRLIAWQSAYLGFKDRPILGWGYENYYQPFDKYFNPKIYRHEGSVVWFDRAHNLIFDRLVAGGILGLGSYLAFLILPFCYLWRYYFKKAEHKNKYFLPVVFSLIALAYFIQNLFIFEALVIYVPLFMVLAFVGLYAPYYQVRIFDRLSFRVVVALIWLVAIIPIVYLVNVKPLQANMELFSILVGKDAKVEQKIDLFKSLLARDTYGNQEYRKQLHFFLEDFKNDLDTTIKNNPEQVEKIINQYSPTIIELSNFTKAQINRQIEENPYSASNYLLAMKYNNFVFTRIKRFDILAENTKLFNQAKTLSPKRQHIYFELGYTYLHLAQALKTTGQDDLAQEAYQVAISQFEFALSLNDHNFESYKQLIFANILAGYNESAINLYTLAKNTGVAVNEITVLSQIIATAEFADNTEMIQYFSDKLKSSNQID